MSDLNIQLLNAVENNNLKLVKNLINQGADINTKYGEYQMTLLTHAIYYGFDKITNFLIDNNIKLNEQNTVGETDLMRAVSMGNIDIVKKLIEHGADVDIEDQYKNTAIHYINCINNDKIKQEIKNLLQNAKQIRQEYLENLNNQLLNAVKDNNLNLVKNLIKQGADINIKDDNGDTPLIVAVRYKNKGMDIIKYLVDNGANLDTQNKDGNTALIIAVSSGTEKSVFETIQYLVNKGAKLNIQNNNGDTALIKVSSNVYKDTIEYLLNNGADPNIKNKNGDFALIKSIYATRRNADVVKLFLNYGADVNMKNRANETALMCASCINDVDLVKYLIKCGADLDVESINGHTALFCAIECGCEDVVKILIENGVNINTKNQKGYTALEYIEKLTKRYLKQEIKNLLQNAEQIRQEYLQMLGKQLIDAIRNSNTEDEILNQVITLINKGADVNTKDNNDTVVLTYAICRNYTNIIKILIKNGANINVEDKYKNTPLTKVMTGDNKDILEIFIDNKCINIDEIIDKNGNTLLSKTILNGYKSTANMLIEKDVNINIQNKMGDTPLMIAIDNSRRYLLKKLLECNVDVNIQNKDGKTALIKMLENYEDEDDIEIFENLCKIGANPYIEDNTKRNAFDYIKDIDDEESMEKIKNLLQNADTIRQEYLLLNNKLFNAVKDNNLNLVKNLIKQGANINAQNSTKSTPLMIAVFLNNKEMVEFLIKDSKINIHIQNENGYTALDYAKYNKNKNIQEQIRRKRYVEIDNFNDIIEEFSENITDKSKVTCPLD